MSKFVEEISNEFEADLIFFEKLIKNNQEEDSFIIRDCIMRNIIGLLETIEGIDDSAFDKFKIINYEEGWQLMYLWYNKYMRCRRQFIIAVSDGIV